MSLLPAFEHDVFVSYAHVDDLPDREGERGWVERFGRRLSMRLLKRFGEPLDVWSDPKLARTQLFDPVIERAVRGSSLLVTLISEPYLKSEYCRKEIEWFEEETRTGPHPLVVGDRVRIFPVLLYNIPWERWPDALKGLSGSFPFYEAEGEEHGVPLDPDSKRFDDAFTPLVEEIHAALRLLERRSAAAPASPEGAGKGVEEAAAARAPGFSLFLADAPDELGPARRRLAARLRGEGIEVVTDVPPPFEPAPHEAAVREALGKVSLTVHLLGTQPGEPLEDVEDSARTYPLEQARLALDAPPATLFLAPDYLEPGDIASPAYAEFYRALEERPRESGSFELVRTSQNRMIAEILSKRDRLREEARRADRAGRAGIDTAFIDLHTEDLPLAADLIGYLGTKRIAPVVIPSSDLSPKASMELFEANLKKAGLFLIVFGRIGRGWVEERLNEAFKLILSNRLDTRIGVYVAPPEKSSEEIEFPPLFGCALNMKGFDPKSIDGLIAPAGGAGG